MIKNTNFPKLDMGSPQTLRGKSVAIIGGTGGIGRALSKHFAAYQAKVIVVGQTFRDADVEGIEFIKADLSLMSEARRVAALLPVETLDMLIFTTGIFAAPKRQGTAEGLERDMAVSYLNRLVIMREIAERLGSENTTKTRVFIMGYPGSGKMGTLGDLNAENHYRPMEVHMNTVAGNEIMVLDGANNHKNISVFGLNPGLIKTNIRSNFLGGNKLLFRLLETIIGIFTSTAEQYAKVITPLLISPQLDDYSGTLFNNKCRAIKPSKGIIDSHHMQLFINQSWSLIDAASKKQK
ncbi:NAD(P)-dependent dehydrogenase (short-subunit alcohol dehydrogenase family) [Enterobacter sp. BIGb0383]|uniref:SDR family NAD(P)-dependent oxidoreductase n=1 Tax=unclassified Enterobacter TaxID=2608935 RepID=UPI000F45F5FD|nr:MULTISPECIES: SDR family NAD(P)-dependent oxidoreductase [unclassified Enterobacter]ROP61703.1 NAD(P)-dependent dehydrogenase (short-subunit alcohol dehydrogenase family) [Enterobacter sp. BIGb0383]ROS11864.1 NAD(P)-dependent dehydrogenase (short-subunit alcohol dehydrogenase family) [Enterobacter sp. BIGb0359]